MPVTPAEARDLFERTCRFPTDRESVLESCGETSVRPPNGDPVPIENVLERTDADSYESLSELHNTLMANLSEDHVGRKAYDDRSPNPGRDEDLSL